MIESKRKSWLTLINMNLDRTAAILIRNIVDDKISIPIICRFTIIILLQLTEY